MGVFLDVWVRPQVVSHEYFRASFWRCKGVHSLLL